MARCLLADSRMRISLSILCAPQPPRLISLMATTASESPTRTPFFTTPNLPLPSVLPMFTWELIQARSWGGSASLSAREGPHREDCSIGQSASSPWGLHASHFVPVWSFCRVSGHDCCTWSCVDPRDARVERPDLVLLRFPLLAFPIFYWGFEDRAAAEMWDDLGFLVSPNDEGYDCVNAEDCVKVIV